MIKTIINKITGEEEQKLPPLSDDEMVLSRELEAMIQDRRKWEQEWATNETSLLDVGAEGNILSSRFGDYAPDSASDDVDAGSDNDVIDNFMGVNLSARNLQLIHSQLCSNPPVCMASPSSNEVADIDAAGAAEMIMEHGREKYHFFSHIWNWYLNVFYYGSGAIKQVFDKSIGATIVAESGMKARTGDHVISVPRIWDLYIDTNATCWEEVTRVTERMYVPYETAVAFLGEEASEMLAVYCFDTAMGPHTIGSAESMIKQNKFGIVELFERWEAGTEQNDWKGSLVYHLRDGRILRKQVNPCAHEWFPEKGKHLDGKKARLPYSWLTYESIPGQVYGRSPAIKTARAQVVLNSCYMVVLNTAQNMGTPNLVVDVNALGEQKDKAKSNNSVNIIPLDLSGMAGGSNPYVLQAANSSDDIKELIVRMETYINDAWGVTDAMLGKQSRETQGITMQLSIMQGNMIRESLFLKSIQAVKDFYLLFLADVAEHWKKSQLIQAIGMDNKRKADRLSGSNILGGYVLQVERGSGFALDPITRQEQLLNLQGVFQNAGVDPRFLIKQLRFAAFRSIYDEFDKSDSRAEHWLEQIRKKKPAKIFENEDHIGIVAYMRRYVMTDAFLNLDEEIQGAIEQHIGQREQKIAQAMAPQMGPAAAGQGAASVPPGPPMIGPA